MDEKKQEALSNMFDLLTKSMTIEEVEELLIICADSAFAAICNKRDIDEYHPIRQAEVAALLVHRVEFELLDYLVPGGEE